MFTPQTAAMAGRRSSRKGKPNKATTDIRQVIKTLLEDSADQLTEDFLSLDSKDRLLLACKLMEYVIPKASLQTLETPTQVSEVRIVIGKEDLESDPIE
jgi:hypothetical protein